MFALSPHFFGSFTHTLTIPFAPYSEAMLLSIECLILAETCHAVVGTTEGPILNLILFAPWNDFFPNSELYPTNKTHLKMANYWKTFIDFFYTKTRHQPLPLELLITIKRDFLILLETKTNQNFYCKHEANIYDAWNGVRMIKDTTITVHRPFLEINPIPKPLGNQWLHLREQFNNKKVPTNGWSNETYLQKHKKYYEEYLATQENESET